MLRVTCFEKPRWFVRSYAPQRIWTSSSVTKNFLVEMELVPNWQGNCSMLLLLFLPVVACFKTKCVIPVCFAQHFLLVIFNRNNQFAKILKTSLKSGLLTKCFYHASVFEKELIKKNYFLRLDTSKPVESISCAPTLQGTSCHISCVSLCSLLLGIG